MKTTIGTEDHGMAQTMNELLITNLRVVFIISFKQRRIETKRVIL